MLQRSRGLALLALAPMALGCPDTADDLGLGHWPGARNGGPAV